MLKHSTQYWLALALSAFSLIAQANSSAGLRRPLLIKKQVPDVVLSSTAVPFGVLPATQTLKLAISLPLRNQDALARLLQELYDPQSPQYHRYLAPKAFTDRFGPAAADYGAVISWAKQNDLVVTRTSSSRQVLDVTGTVRAINRALHIDLRTYWLSTESRVFFSPDREPTLDLSVPIYAIAGLENAHPPRSHLLRGTARQIKRTPHTGSGPKGDFTPSDIRAAYYGNGPLTGKGQSVGVLSFCDYDASDLQLFYKTAHMQAPSAGTVQNVPVNKPSFAQCDGSDGEQILDIGNVLGMAPNVAHLYFYEGDSAVDILNQIADDDRVSIISNSWYNMDFGLVGPGTYRRLAAQGQTFVNGSGDWGSFSHYTWGPPQLNPYSLDVGGTSMTTTGPGGAWQSSTAWSCDAQNLYCSGGGYLDTASGGFAIPGYQQAAGVINAFNKGSRQYRNDPDVAAEADEDNFTVENGRVITDDCGTSYAAPRWAGFLALANENAQSHGHAPVGFVNPALYQIGLRPDYTTAFHSITQGSNGGFNAVPGYDLVTGWGSPNGATLIHLLSD